MHACITCSSNRVFRIISLLTGHCVVILLSGLPGAGKDSYIKKHLPGLPVISLDDIRVKKINIAPTDKTGNGHVIQAAKEQARVFLRSKTPFIWNATNSTRSMRTQLVELYTTAVLKKLAWKLEPPAAWEAHEVIYDLSCNATNNLVK